MSSSRNAGREYVAGGRKNEHPELGEGCVDRFALVGLDQRTIVPHCCSQSHCVGAAPRIGRPRGHPSPFSTNCVRSPPFFPLPTLVSPTLFLCFFSRFVLRKLVPPPIPRGGHTAALCFVNLLSISPCQPCIPHHPTLTSPILRHSLPPPPGVLQREGGPRPLPHPAGRRAVLPRPRHRPP